MKESAELLDALAPGFKMWQRVDLLSADEEAIDILLYLLEYWLARDMSEDDIMRIYDAKHAIVLERIETKEKVKG